MNKLLFFLTALFGVNCHHVLMGQEFVAAEPSVYDVAERQMHEDSLAKSETTLQNALTQDPMDDRARFQLGIVQFFRAVETLGQSLHEHGAASERAFQPFLRLPVPDNPEPATISYHDVSRILDIFIHELERAEATLAKIKNEKVVTPLRLLPIRLNFTGDPQQATSLLDLLNHFNRQELKFEKDNPEFLVHFDRGDVAWLRAYCHLLSAMAEGYQAIDGEIGFEDRMREVFPRITPSTRDEPDDWYRFLPISDPPRLRRMRLHMLAVCELNEETWQFIRQETDDEFEWLPHPKQTDQLGIPVTDAQIDRWLAMMLELKQLFSGEKLISSDALQYFVVDHPEGQGLNLAKVLDNPPEDLFNEDRIRQQGIAPDFLEPEEGKERFNLNVLVQAFFAFNGPFGFFNAVRMN